MIRKSPPDYTFLGLAGALVVFGLVMLISASGPVGYERYQDAYYFVKHQLIYGLIPGVVLFLIFLNIDYRFFKKIYFWLYCFSIFILLLVFVPGLGANLKDAKSWVDLRIFTFQPAEISKLTFLFFLAAWFEMKGDKIKDLKEGALAFFGVLAPIIGLVMLQPDIGTMVGIALMAFSLYFLAGADIRHICGFIAAGFISLIALIKVAPYRMDRFTAFLNPKTDPLGIGYHINQALLAIGSGGLFGLGLGHSRQKFQYLPEVVGDSIFAVMSEELGFFFIVGFLILFVVFLLRILKISRGAQDDYGRFLALGIVSWFGIQAFINIGSMVGLLPMTGLTLPFISYGGTSLAISMAAVGVVANISKNSLRK
jgi:cell division protein FtsW